MKKIFITGVNGQDGAYLSKLLLEKGYEVYGSIKSGNADLYRLKYLNIDKKISLIPLDLCSYLDVRKLIEDGKYDEIYNLAAISSVSNSFKYPYETLNFNINSVINLLESIKNYSPKTKLYQASSSEMFGRVENLPIKGDEHFHPLSPYAVSKASAHMMAKNYRETYGLFICTGILFNHESFLRADNFFIKKVIQQSIQISKGRRSELIVGNIDIRRDFGLAEKYVEAMYLIMQSPKPNDYIVCSGQSIMLRDVISYVFKKFDISDSKLNVDGTFFRPNELKEIYGDNSKIKNELKWEYNLDTFDLLDRLINEELENENLDIK